MATIGGLSNNTSSSMNMYGASIKGYGGLASGLDTDSLIEGMTVGTRTKISELLKKKTSYQWEMDAYRSVSDKLIAFDSEYLNLTSSSSPYRTSFFDRSLVTMKGLNSQYLGVSGASPSLDRLKILGVGQLAEDTALITNHKSSAQSLNMETFDLDGTIDTANLENGSLKITFGTYDYSLNFKSGTKFSDEVGGGETDFSTPEKVVETINKMLKSTKLADGSGDTLADKVSMSQSGNKLVLTAGADLAGNSLYISGGSADALQVLGFLKSDKTGLVGEGKITETGLMGEADVTAATLVHKEPITKIMSEKTMTFDYNGKSKLIAMPKAIKQTDGSLKFQNADGTVMTDDNFKDYFQGQLDKAFGAGKITLTDQDTSAGKLKLSFKTSDSSSILRIKDAGSGLMGEKGLFGIGFSTTNRLATETPLDKSGLLIPTNLQTEYQDFGKPNADGKYKELKLNINDINIEGLTEHSSVSEIIRKINDSDAGVKVNYLEASDRFTITSTNQGESGTIKLGEDFSRVLFGKRNADGTLAADPDDATKTAYEVDKGQDAVMIVEYEGGVKGTIKRDSNNFKLEGSTFTLKDTFGVELQKDASGKLEYGADGEVLFKTTADYEPVTFSTSVDAEKMSKVISKMIDDYNTIIKEVNTQVSKKPDRNYGPLTDDEKKNLSESQIKGLEDKGKEGILFNDPLLRSLADKMRTVFTGVADAGTLKSMGINVSSSYKDDGKIYFNEETFKNAVTEDPDKIKDLFTKPAVKDPDGNLSTKGGISVRLKSIAHDFVNTTGTKGSLIKKAGSTASPNSILDNAIKKLMNEIDDDVDSLKVKLQTEIDRYSKQFSSLEQLISQMNSQSSWFSQAG